MVSGEVPAERNGKPNLLSKGSAEKFPDSNVSDEPYKCVVKQLVDKFTGENGPESN